MLGCRCLWEKMAHLHTIARVEDRAKGKNGLKMVPRSCCRGTGGVGRRIVPDEQRKRQRSRSLDKVEPKKQRPTYIEKKNKTTENNSSAKGSSLNKYFNENVSKTIHCFLSLSLSFPLSLFSPIRYQLPASLDGCSCKNNPSLIDKVLPSLLDPLVDKFFYSFLDL